MPGGCGYRLSNYACTRDAGGGGAPSNFPLQIQPCLDPKHSENCNMVMFCGLCAASPHALNSVGHLFHDLHSPRKRILFRGQVHVTN